MTTATKPYRYARLRVRYFDVTVPAVVSGRAVYFPLRALCKVLGMSAQMQKQRIERLAEKDSRFTGALHELPIPTIKGLRDATCINKRHVAVWLSIIDPGRSPLTARGTIERFQQELFDAADRFLFGDLSDVVQDPATRTAVPITGTLHLGSCPRCGLRLRLDTDADGMHLRPDEDGAHGEQDGEE